MPLIIVVYILVLLGALFLVVRIMRFCFGKISDWYVIKNKDVFFKVHKNSYLKIKQCGKKIAIQYQEYQNLLNDLGFNRVIRCSDSVVSSSIQNPVKYVLKYSNVENSLECMGKLECVSDFLRDYAYFVIDIQKTRNKILKTLPKFCQLFGNKGRLPYAVCDIDCRLSSIQLPFLRFLYVSPAGKASYANKITIDTDTIGRLVGEISNTLNKKGHSLHQRSIMTNDLREAIKKRDNYTCCECGNSVYNEPNLLLEVDHIVPVSRGGKTESSNLQTLCWRCNRRKSNKE